MKHARYYLLVALAILAFVLPSIGCGPDFPEATFFNRFGPDQPYAAFAAGRIGIPQPEFRTRNLVIAYNYYTGRPLTPLQQKQTADTDTYFLSNASAPPYSKATGVAAWLAATGAMPAPSTDPNTPVSAPNFDRAVPGDTYNNFTNCLDDAFATAAYTYSSRIHDHGASDPAVAEWLRGQKIVFSNCSSGSNIPAPVTAPTWLVQDRAYQIAAANFYALNYDAALAQFRAIAADISSPWSTTARYLVARTLIRRATLAAATINANYNDTTRDQKSKQVISTGFTAARTELLAMQAEPRMKPLLPAIADLLDLVALRLDPTHQATVLAKRLQSPTNNRFSHDLIDFTYLRNNNYTPAPAATPDMQAWLDTVTSNNHPSAMKHWQATAQPVWLVAAMMSTQPIDPDAATLVHAAESTPTTSPAFVAITYQRLRLTPPSAAARKELLTLAPTLEKTESISTLNLFATLRLTSSPTLETWLAEAARTRNADIDGFDPFNQDGLSTKIDPKTDTQPCGPPVAAANLRLFTPDAAFNLNTRFPLAVLAKAAEAPTLPPNLRFAAAQSTWARAVILTRPEVARRMSPILIACHDTWRPVLDAYDNAKTPPDRQANGLLALMRFASTEPYVRAGDPRDGGFAGYSDYRDNWWFSTPQATIYALAAPDNPSQPRSAQQTVPTPLFLTSADIATANAEFTTIASPSYAADYFATQTLAFVHANPHDPRNADLLGEALRVERNSNGDKATTQPLARQLFEAIQLNYPQSSWAKKYKTYE